MTHTLPALTWLINHDSDAALAMFHRLRDEYYTCGSEPEQPSTIPISSADEELHDAPDEMLTAETMCSVAQNGPDEHWPEMLHSIEPELHEMLRSAGGVAWPWCGVRTKKRGKISWQGEPWAYEFNGEQTLIGRHLIRLAGLMFYTRPNARRGMEGGTLLSFINDAGEVSKPSFKAEKPRGGKRPYRTNPVGYLALPAVIPSPLEAHHLHREFSGEPALPPMYVPQDGVEEARAILRQFGVDGSVPFCHLPNQATLGPTTIAKNARFMGGMTGRCQTASVAVTGKVEDSAPLAAVSAKVVEEVASRGTLESIGIKLGYRGGYADRGGKKALLNAGREIIAANENTRAKKDAA
ncbi:hypothetical protein HNR26_000008 [Rhizobium rosettiformans]|uniref:Uncharacterized protein n=2 Tax=Rhizobium rosettiformans TaxID=1368430 RepID=A0A4S8Q2Y4_9HYPH|nr:hypothetical protein [Rhizobium rosettiformans]MBB5273970.1 hypothetical protein [Rhizobium rosettiformans]THV38360.1 hypothetical protein FAA86_06115 [Rhizobium rosettiformans W3]